MPAPRRVTYFHGWNVVAFTLAIQAVTSGIVVYSFALFVVPWLAEFEVQRAAVMLAVFLLQIAFGVISPFCGRLLDRYRIRTLVMLGGGAAAAGLLAMSFATALWQVVLIHLTLLPVGMALAGTLASQTLVTKWFVANRGLAIGISTMGTSLGGFGFPLLTAWLIGAYGWQDTLRVLAAVALALTVPGAFFVLRRSPPAAGLSGGPALPEIAPKRFLRSRAFWIPIICFVPVTAAFGGVQFSLGAYVFDLGFEQGLAATLIAIGSVSMILGKFTFGSLGDRVDHRKLYWLSAAGLAAALGLYLAVPSRAGLVAAGMLQGFATGSVLPLLGVMYAARFGVASFGRVLGWVNLFLMAGSIGSLYSGWIFDLTGSYRPAFLTFLVAMAPAAVLMAWLPAAEEVDRHA